MEKSLKLSIIIPVYNTGELLRDCIDSVIAQTLKEFELILIDDGSTDNSGAICDEYAEKDSRIRVLHKQNQGVSIARNVGLGLVRGEFVGFIDSDDTVEPKMYQTMLEKAVDTGAEIVMCDAVTVYGNGAKESDTVSQMKKSHLIKKNNFTPKLLMEMAGSACRCIYRSNLIMGNQIEFLTGLKFSEDRIFNIYAFGFCNGVYYIKRPFYNRLIREDSAVHRFHEDYFEMAKKADSGTLEALKKAWGNKDEYKNAYRTHFVTAAIGAINNYFYKTSTLSFKKKYEKIKVLCADEQLLNAMNACDYSDIRIKWIKRKQILLLCISAVLLNKKYSR